MMIDWSSLRWEMLNSETILGTGAADLVGVDFCYY
jgi:hypothetical protein